MCLLITNLSPTHWTLAPIDILLAKHVISAIYISQFTSTIRHVPGTDNIVADALSRIKTIALLSG